MGNVNDLIPDSTLDSTEESTKEPTMDDHLKQHLGLRKFDTIVSIEAEGNRATYTLFKTERSNLILEGVPLESFSLVHTITLLSSPVPTELPLPENTEVMHILQEIQITFDNHLHEISRKYSYEIRVVVETNVGYEEIYSGIHIRSDAFLHFKDMTLRLFKLKPQCKKAVKNFHLIIRRFGIEADNFGEDECELGKVLLDDRSISDVSVVVGDRVISVHKSVLASKSEVFKAMFAHDMRENQEGIVKIDEFDAETIEELIYYIYTGKTKRLPEISRELFEAAHKYQVHDLERLCTECMIFNLNFDNAIDIVDLTYFYKLGSLRKKVYNFIKKHEDEMVKNEHYEEFLGRNVNVNNVASKLNTCVKYNLVKLKKQVFDFIKENKKDVSKNQSFLDLFDSQASLMRELFTYLAD